MAKKGFFSWFRPDKSGQQTQEESQPPGTQQVEKNSANEAEQTATTRQTRAESDVQRGPARELKDEAEPAAPTESRQVPQETEAQPRQTLSPENDITHVTAEPPAVAGREASTETQIKASDKESVAETQAELQPEPRQKPSKEGLFARLRRGLKRTSVNIGSGFIGLFKGKKIDDELFEELEEQLLIADAGVETTTRLIGRLTEHASRKQLKDAEALYELMRKEMRNTLEPVSEPLVPELPQGREGPFVILMVGVNGVGKTTTIGKLAEQYQRQGKSVMLAAGDTFRAAAVEQLQIWGQRSRIPVIAQHTGADSASVLFDALQAAKARDADVLIADTAGRLQNKSHLMEELKKVVRVMKKLDETAPHEVMLTLDASTGQNALSQAQLFREAVGVTGITLTKMDGTAKGGVIFAIADKFKLPIRYIGVGERIDDLRPFVAEDFIDALFSAEGQESDSGRAK